MRRVVPVVIFLVASGLFAACGLPEDSAPRAIGNDALPDELDPSDSSTTLPPDGAQTRQVYLVSEQGETRRLVAVDREVPSPARMKQTLESLLQQPDSKSEFRTLLDPRTEILNTTLNDGVLTINLAEPLAGIEGEGLPLAFSQIVYTATQPAFPNVESVEFQEGGDPVDVPNDEGRRKSRVRRTDYLEFRPIDD